MAITLDGTNGITTPDLESSGPVIGTTGTFSGNVSGVAGTFSGAVQASGVTTNLYPLVSETAKAFNWNGVSTNTFIDFTGIPSWVKRITVVLNVVSTSGTSNIQLQLGDSGGIENTSYDSRSGNIDGTNATSAATLTSGFLLKFNVAAASTYIGQIVIVNISSNLWVCSSSVAAANGLSSFQNGTKTLSDTLTQVRITTVNGTDTFDAGTINIMYE